MRVQVVKSHIGNIFGSPKPPANVEPFTDKNCLRNVNVVCSGHALSFISLRELEELVYRHATKTEETIWNVICWKCQHLEGERRRKGINYVDCRNIQNHRRGPSSPDYAECGHFTLLLCRKRLRNEPRFIIHVQRYYMYTSSNLF